MHNASTFILLKRFCLNVKLSYNVIEEILIILMFDSIKFKFICIALFTMQIIAKQLYRELKFLHYI